MNQTFQGWEAVAQSLCKQADRQDALAHERGEAATRLNAGQRDSLRAIASRIITNGVVIADEVGMGKTRIAVEVVHSVIACGGRAAILVPPGLGYQWQTELRDGQVQCRPLLRSLWAYLAAWESEEAEQQQPWFRENVVMVSHAFTNWRLGERTDPWRWALVPELYARWREATTGRVPRDYHANDILSDAWTYNAAQSIVAAISSDRKHSVGALLDELLQIQWPRPLDAAEYSQGSELRMWLERCIGCGLGIFDLVVIDEAHKSRGTGSGLSRLLDKVILSAKTTRRFALTATPVELDVSQWQQILDRLKVAGTSVGAAHEAITRYAEAIQRVRRSWRSSSEARAAFKDAASQFHAALSPYLLRRDKREDPAVQAFGTYSKCPINAYRQENEINVNPVDLSMTWRKAICAAESLSVVTHQADDPVAKRLRLTLGNGHGIAALIDQTQRDDDDRKQEQYDKAAGDTPGSETVTGNSDKKRQERAKWWLNVMTDICGDGQDPLFEHPAIAAAVRAIEGATSQGEKVLVFGRFTLPLRRLVDLLNAREMLRRLQNNEPWPQGKVHADEWPAVRAAHRQLNSPIALDGLDERMRAAYERGRGRRERFRERLRSLVEGGLPQIAPSPYVQGVFDAFARAASTPVSSDEGEQHPLTVVSRAVLELLGHVEGQVGPLDCAKAFSDVVLAASDRDDAESDEEIDDDRAAAAWETIKARLRDEYSRPQGGFARLMYGGTLPDTRRMLQLAFNRPQSFPRVLVAQSLVGREGLNLHHACRIVVILHPEWNPGVVEQQIGRVDRVDSHWANALMEAIARAAPADQLPRIEIRPVIFRGTYDEHNWQVLRERWDNLRAQLHGIVIRPELADTDGEGRAFFEEISRAAPSFSPTRSRK